MINLGACPPYSLNIVVVNYGLGSKVISIAKESGITGGTVVLGRTSSKNAILKFLELSDCRKEVVLIMSKDNHEEVFLDSLGEKLELDTPGNGFAISTSIDRVVGTHYCKNSNEMLGRRDGNMGNYDSMFVIVDRGDANDVVELASEAGASETVILNGRGAGVHETSKIFALDIEQEKEIVLILVEKEKTQNVCELIRSKFEIDRPGKGIMFIQSVDRVCGI